MPVDQAIDQAIDAGIDQQQAGTTANSSGVVDTPDDYVFVSEDSYLSYIHALRSINAVQGQDENFVFIKAPNYTDAYFNFANPLTLSNRNSNMVVTIGDMSLNLTSATSVIFNLRHSDQSLVDGFINLVGTITDVIPAIAYYSFTSSTKPPRGQYNLEMVAVFHQQNVSSPLVQLQF